MSSKTIKNALQIIGFLSLMGGIILGVNLNGVIDGGLFAGILVGFISMIMCFGFGNLISDVEEIRENIVGVEISETSETDKDDEEEITTVEEGKVEIIDGVWTCPVCGETNIAENTICTGCMQFKPKL